MMNRQKGLFNILSLDDRLRIITAYSEQPCYKKLEDEFKCTSKQINYILNQRNLLTEDAPNGVYSCVHRRNLQDIAMIDRVMTEWYYRAKMYSNTEQITYKTIREKVGDAKKALNIDTFLPTSAWMTKFRNDCDKNLDRKKNRKDVLKSLDLKTIARHVISDLNFQRNKNLPNNVDQKIGFETGSSAGNCSSPSLPDRTVSKPVEVIEIDDDDEEDAPSKEFKHKIIKTSPNDTIPADPNKKEISKKEQFALQRTYSRTTNQDNRLIKSSGDALRYLRPLEDFVLLNENYRAIGLLTQIEAHFCKTNSVNI